MNVKKKGQMYRIRLKVAVWRDQALIYRNTSYVPAEWSYVDVQHEIEKQIKSRLDSGFFRCQDKDFDLVKYTDEARSRTYLRLDPWPKVDEVA